MLPALLFVAIASTSLIAAAWYLAHSIAKSFQDAPYRDSYLDGLLEEMRAAAKLAGGGEHDAPQPSLTRTNGSHSHDAKGFNP